MLTFNFCKQRSNLWSQILKRQNAFHIIPTLLCAFIIIVIHYNFVANVKEEEKRYQQSLKNYQAKENSLSKNESDQDRIIKLWRENYRDVVVRFLSLPSTTGFNTCLSHYAQDKSMMILQGKTTSSYLLSHFLQLLQNKLGFYEIKMDELNSDETNNEIHFKAHSEMFSEEESDNG